MDLDNDHMDNALQKSNNEFEFVEVKMEAAEELDVDQDQCDVDSSLPRIKNEFEYVEIKMENPEELDVEQKASGPNAGSKLCNEVDSFIRDPLLIKDEKGEYPQDDPDPMPRELYILGHSVAERSESAVLERLKQDELEPKQQPSSPVYSCPKYEAKPLSDDLPHLKYIADNDDDQSGDTAVGGSSPASSPFFSCTQCDFKCTRHTALSKHISTHHVAAESNEEGTIRTTKQSTSKHLPTSNIEGKLFSCELCDFKTRYGHHLKRHLFRHTGEKLYSCEFCEYKSTQSGNLKVHVRKHTGDKPYNCELCGFKTATSSDLKVHMGKHTGEKRYSCEFCEYKSSQSGRLKEHLRIHTGEKPFACVLCEFKATSSSNLKVHMRKHTGEKPYNCVFCEYKSTQSGNLKLHMIKHTGEKRIKYLEKTFKKAFR